MNPIIQLYATGPTPIYDPSYDEVRPLEEAAAQKIVDLGWNLSTTIKGFMFEAFAWKTTAADGSSERKRHLSSNFVCDIEEKPNVVLRGLECILEELTTEKSVIEPASSLPKNRFVY